MNFQYAAIISLMIAIILLQLIILPSPGTIDMDYFIKVTKTLDEHGLKEGFSQYNLYYPPISSIIIYPIVKFVPNYSELSKYLQTLPIKITLAIFYYLFLLLILCYYKKIAKYSWLKSLKKTARILINIALIEYVFLATGFDILMAPALFLAFFFIYKQKYFWSGMFLAVAFMTKLLPILLIPAFLVYFSSKLPHKKINIQFKNIILLCLGILVVIIPLICYFDNNALIDIVKVSDGHSDRLSAAYNFNRIIRESFNDGNATSPIVFYFGRIMFFLISSLLLIKLWISPKNIQILLYTSIGIFFAYFIFFAGVHQNHIFPAFILTIFLIMYKENSLNIFLYYVFSIIAFANMFLFYGIGYLEKLNSYTGIGFFWEISQTQLSTIYVLTSVITVTFFFYYIWIVLRLKNPE
ncbi:MAG: glycosyltransferase family 87 protein [Patescibacteria group bacterium]